MIGELAKIIVGIILIWQETVVAIIRSLIRIGLGYLNFGGLMKTCQITKAVPTLCISYLPCEDICNSHLNLK